MQVSIKWLHDYIDFNESAEELADKLTMAGIPVENVIRADEGLDKVVTGRIESIVPHPDSDHMVITQMNVGLAENVQIVTGAQNVREGQIVPVAMIGANLPNGMKISKGKLRGVASNGMLCSAQELKLDLTKLPEEQKTGIYILPEDTAIGIPAKEVLGLDDVVLEFELTANRGDCFSVWGLVREVAVLTGNTPKWPEIKVDENEPENTSDMVSVKIEAPELCYRFSSRVLKNVKIGPSPEWMQQRLEGAGIRAINNVVDVTNFVMVELGQPMHAYDYDQVAGHTLIARKAVAGENLHTLDDSSRLAKGEELVIADSEKPAGLAGVMGGLESEVTDNTTTVILEAAAFNGPSIRRTSRSCGLHSEASGRFERGVDVTETQRALNRAAQLLQEMGACTVTKGIVDVYPEPKQPVSVYFTAEQINNRLGTDIPAEKMVEILESLCFGVTAEGEGYRVSVPSWRNDVIFMEDLSEEIARIYGFDNIHAGKPQGCMVQGRQSERQEFIDMSRLCLSYMGMSEELSFSFTSPDMLDKMNLPADHELRKAIPIMNPLTDEYPLVRTSLIASVLENAVRNISRKNEDLKLFDIAPVFYPKQLPLTELPTEAVKIAGLMCGRRYPLGWNNDNNAQIDFYDAKGIVEEYLDKITVNRYTVEAGEHYAMHPGKTALFKKGKEVIAAVGELHPKIAENMGITKKCYIFDMDVDVLMKYMSKKITIEQLPKFPGITRDLAMLVDANVTEAEIERVISKNAGNLFKGVTLFDVYTGKQVEEGKKSIAFTMQFQSNERTLTDKEVDEAFQNILAAVQKEFNAELRG
ncbi:MAG: phenylalanine--tRNA ligase subunit beta [Selenomonadaceae bacterium]|nr:phenylalanine--tRNA ligase subunit beta [Selenomonadaceae bacterium]